MILTIVDEQVNAATRGFFFTLLMIVGVVLTSRKSSYSNKPSPLLDSLSNCGPMDAVVILSSRGTNQQSSSTDTEWQAQQIQLVTILFIAPMFRFQCCSLKRCSTAPPAAEQKPHTTITDDEADDFCRSATLERVSLEIFTSYQQTLLKKSKRKRF